MVSFMKKVLIILCVFLSLYGVYKIRRNNKSIPVSFNTDTFFNLDDYNVYYLSLEEENITTHNLNTIITSDMTIISINPYVNPIYSNKINLKYTFENISYKKNIRNFIRYYKDTINKSGINDDLNYIDIDGIKINEMEVYAKGSDIVNMIYSNPYIKYRNYINKNYNYLEF